MAVKLADSPSPENRRRIKGIARRLGYEVTIKPQGVLYCSPHHGGFISFTHLPQHIEGKYKI